MKLELESNDVRKLDEIARRYGAKSESLVRAVVCQFLKEERVDEAGVRDALIEQQHNLAMSFNFISEKLRRSGDSERALRGLEEAARILEGVVTSSEGYRSDLALVLSNLGLVRGEAGQVVEAVEIAARVKKIRMKILEEDRTSKAHIEYALSLRDYASALDNAGSTEEAYGAASTAVDLYEEHSHGSHDHALALYNLGSIANKIEKDSEAAEALEKSVALLEGLRREPDLDIEEDLARALDQLGDCVGTIGKSAALDVMRRSVAVRTKLVARDPSDVEAKAKLAVSCYGLCNRLQAADKESELVELVPEYVALLDELYQFDRKRFATMYAHAKLQLALMLGYFGHDELAIRLVRQSMPVHEQQAREDSEAKKQLLVARELIARLTDPTTSTGE